MKEYICKDLKIRYYETDKMQIVHHSNYLRYFEIARLEFLESLGISYATVEKKGIILPVVSVKIDYKHSVTFGDTINIKTRLLSIPKVRMTFDYIILNPDEKIVCQGETVLAFLDAKTRKPIRCPDYLSKTFSSLFVDK